MKLRETLVKAIGVGFTMLLAMQAAGTEEVDPTAFEIPYPGSGTILSVHSFGSIGWGTDRGAYITRAASRVRIDVAKPYAARWIDRSEIVVSENLQNEDQSWTARVTRFTSESAVLGSWNISPFRSLPAPSPNGKFFLWDELGSGIMKVSLHVAPATDRSDIARNPEHTRTFPPMFVMGKPVWSWDSTAIALSIGVSTPRGRYYPRLHILDLRSGDIRRIQDAVAPRERERGGTKPILWTENGLFAAAGPRILRCGTSSEDGGCSLVHEFEEWQFVKGGTSIGNGRAYILVSDLRPDPFEVRANELHEVDLVNGGAKLLLKLPENVYLDSIEWMPDEP